jgi:hypothetical protein
MPISADEVDIVNGVLRTARATVFDAMTPADKVSERVSEW